MMISDCPFLNLQKNTITSKLKQHSQSDNFAFLFNCTPVGRTSDSMWFRLKDLSIDKMVGSDALAVGWPTGVYLLDFFCSDIQFYLLLSPFLCFISFLYLDLYVLGDDALIS